MCTVTWFFDADGYELFVNRDELRSRGVAEPPSEAVAGDVRYLAPTDSDAGGTWLAVNELGVAIGLLNAQIADASTDGPPLSRGRLVRDLADLEHPSDLRPRVERSRLERRMPFTLFALAPGGGSVVLDFDGTRVTRRDVQPPELLSSSSLVPGGAAEPRQREFERLLRAGGDRRQAHLDLHRSHAPDRGPLSACMHRPDARTVSFSHVRVERSQVTFAYQDGPPCAEGPSALGRLERRAAPALAGEPADGP